MFIWLPWNLQAARKKRLTVFQIIVQQISNIPKRDKENISVSMCEELRNSYIPQIEIRRLLTAVIKNAENIFLMLDSGNLKYVCCYGGYENFESAHL